MTTKRARSAGRGRRASEVSEERVLSLVEEIYVAAQDSAAWPRVLGSISKEVGATKAGLHWLDVARRAGSGADVWEFEPAWVRSYGEHYAAINPRTIHGGDLLQPGRIVASAEQYPDDAMLRSEFANDWMLPQKIFHSFGAALFRSETVVWNLTFFRPKEQGPFTSQNETLLRKLIPHLTRAVHLRRQFGHLSNEVGALVHSIDQLSTGILLLDESGRVIAENAAARAILSPSDGLRIVRGELVGASPKMTTLLRERVSECLVGQLDATAGPLTFLERPSGRRPLQAVFVPNPRGEAVVGARRPAIIVMLTDPDADISVAASRLGEKLGLTPTETRLATELASARSFEEAAKALKISPNTARTHLKRIFAKTHTRSQAELVSLLLRSVPGRMRS